MTVGPDYSFDRMLKEYVTKFYAPADELGRRVCGNETAPVRVTWRPGSAGCKAVGARSP